jgi:hypothetical protein
MARPRPGGFPGVFFKDEEDVAGYKWLGFKYGF